MANKIKFAMPFIGMALSILGIMFSISKNPWCWPLWILSAIIFLIIEIRDKRLAYIILWIMYLGFDIYGWYLWTR